MEKLEIYGIRRSNIQKIFRLIADRGDVSRAEIAAETGLCVMTVGKVVDAMIGSGIALERKETRASVGRRAGLVSLDRERYAVVFDLSERAFRMSLVDIALDLSDSMSYRYNAKFYYDDNLRLFFKNAKTFLDSRVGKFEPYGVGIAVPGHYITLEDRVVSTKVPELSSIPICSFAEKYLGRGVTLIMKNVEAAAVSDLSRIPDGGGKVAIYLYIGESVDGTVSDHGRIVRGAHDRGCDFGKLVLRCGEPLEDRIARCTSDNMIAEELAGAVYNIITVFDPDTFFIESDRLREPALLIENIKDHLTHVYGVTPDHMPDFLTGGCVFRHSTRGVAMRLRDAWLESLL